MQWKVLAGLRFFLAFIVICYHLKDYVSEYGKDWLCQVGKLNGLAAVLGFLLISGYSIAHSVTRNPKGFYKRRIFRIYPLYVCAIVVSVLPILAFKVNPLIAPAGMAQVDTLTLVGNLFFLQTFLVNAIHTNPALWTLAIEVMCYLLAPLFARLSNQILVFLTAISATCYAIFPYIYELFSSQTSFPFYTYWKVGLPFLLFLWAWLLGFLYFRMGAHLISKILLLGLGPILLIINNNYIGKVGILTYLLSSLILIYSSQIKLPDRVLRGINYLGDISYPLYLFHLPLFIFASYVLGIKNSFSLTLLAGLAAIFFYHAVDVPLRDRRQSNSRLKSFSR
jgi:peptidoglycan/LPS O-acetylase OafA/YrhL